MWRGGRNKNQKVAPRATKSRTAQAELWGSQCGRWTVPVAVISDFAVISGAGVKKCKDCSKHSFQLEVFSLVMGMGE